MKKSQNKSKPKWVKNNLKIQKPSKYAALKKNGLDDGGLVQYGKPAQINPSEKGELASGITKAAGSTGLWGGVYNATQSIADSGRGNGLNATDNTGASLISPSSGFMRAVDDGEWGQAITGLLLPGLGGQNEAKRNQKKKDEASLQQQVLTNKMLQQNATAGMAFEKGGQLASKLGVIKGGELNKISKDAVEVKAHNPTQIDSVELRDAFVDNNEVIDRKNRVFSSTLGFAKEAKKLEKQKHDSPRFKASNDRIEDQLDSLFKEQELSKGGSIHIKKENRGKFNATKKATGKSTEELTHSSNPVTKKRAIFAQNAAKWHHEEGGELRKPKPKFKLDDWRGLTGDANKTRDYKKNPLTTDEIKGWTNELKDRDKAFQEKIYQENQKKPKKASGGWMDELGSYANIAAPTISALLAKKKLKGPASPTLENRVGLKRVNPGAQLADAANQFGQAEKTAQLNTGQSSDLISAIGSLKARKVSANNQIQGQTQQINTDIANQEAGLNVGIGARNAERITGFKQGQNDFSNMKQRLGTEIVSNLSTKLQQKTAENNQIQLDKDKEIIRSYQFSESGVGERMKAKLKAEHPDVYERYYGKGLRMGGRLKKYQ